MYLSKTESWKRDISFFAEFTIVKGYGILTNGSNAYCLAPMIASIPSHAGKGLWYQLWSGQSLSLQCYGRVKKPTQWILVPPSAGHVMFEMPDREQDVDWWLPSGHSAFFPLWWRTECDKHAWKIAAFVGPKIPARPFSWKTTALKPFQFNGSAWGDTATPATHTCQPTYKQRRKPCCIFSVYCTLHVNQQVSYLFCWENNKHSTSRTFEFRGKLMDWISLMARFH